MKFEKESFINFLKSLKKGSELIVQAIEKKGEKVNENFSKIEEKFDEAKNQLSEIKDEIKNKKIDLGDLESGISTDLETIKTAIQSLGETFKSTLHATKTEEVKIKGPIEILKPSWLPKFEISIDPITAFFEEIKNLLKKLTEKESLVLPLKNGRIMVEVDRVGGGGAGGSGRSPEMIANTKGMAPLSGASANGTRDLTVANTWYSVPSTPPTDPYCLVVTVESATGTIRFGFDNTGTPGATNGQKMYQGEDIIVNLAASQVLYFASSTAGDDINWTTKII